MERSEALRLLSRARDGELSPTESDRLQAGLESTPSLRQDREWNERIGEAVRDRRGEPSVPDGLSERILARVRLQSGSAEPGSVAAGAESPRGGLILMLRRSALVAAALLLVGGLVHLSQLPDELWAADSPAEPRSQTFQPGEELEHVLDEREELGEEVPPALRWLLGREGR